MKFYIYHRPMHTIKFKEYMGDLIHVSCEEKDFSPDGEQWKIKRCNRPEAVYNRLNKMLASGGVQMVFIHYPTNAHLRIWFII